MMLSSGAIRTRIGTIVESLCRTAVTEISKIVEDGMMVLRLETCYRESEIKRLKGDIARLQAELRAAQEAGATPRREHGARENLAVQNKETSSIFVTFIPTLDHNSRPVSSVQSRATEDRGGDPAPRPPEPPRAAVSERDCDQATPQNANPGCSENRPPHLASPPEDGAAGGSARHFGFGPYGGGGEPKKEKICPYCGKCFERSAHLERHKMIHTGEKPFQCETCGRCFNQKCSLKEHRKIHVRDAQLALQHSASGDKSKTTESIQNHSLKQEETQPTAPDPAPLVQSQDDVPFSSPAVKSEPIEPRYEPAPPDLTVPQALDDGNDLCLIGPSTSFLSLRPLSPPLDASGGGQQYCINDGGVFDLPRRAPRPKKMYPCPYCPKVFWRSEHLERHVRIHTGEKPYGCYICGRFFSQTSSLKGHMKTHINVKIRGNRLGDNSGLLNAQHANLPSENHTFINVFDSTTPPEWHQSTMVKLEPKEEPLDSECGESLTLMSQDEPWTSGIGVDPLKTEDMDLDGAQINIELVPNDGRCSPLIAVETGRDDDPKQNGNAFEFKDQAPGGASEQSMSSYICSVCGENYDNFNLFQKHQCLEQLHSDEI